MCTALAAPGTSLCGHSSSSNKRRGGRAAAWPSAHSPLIELKNCVKVYESSWSPPLPAPPVHPDHRERVVGSLRNLCYHLQRQRLLQYTLLITPDEK